MERLSSHGYVPMDHRELRLSFRAPRDLLDPDLSIANVQIARGDRQMLNEAKKSENDKRRVWFFMSFPAADGKTVKVDLLIATPYGAMVIKVLDWTGECNNNPGQEWIERNSKGEKITHPNQLAQLDEATQWVRVFLDSKNITPRTISSYLLFSSPHAKPCFTADPRIIVGPSACSVLLAGNGMNSELAENLSYLKLGQDVILNVVEKVKSASIGNSNKSQFDAPGSRSPDENWRKFEACLDAQPQFDLLYLRKNDCYIFGHLDRFEDAEGEKKSNSARSMERLCKRNASKIVSFEHSVDGLIGMPIAFLTGGLGWEPMCRVRIKQIGHDGSSKAQANDQEYTDISSKTRVLFRVYGCEGIVSAEVNDIKSLELASVPRSIHVAEDGTSLELTEQIGQMLSNVLTKSLHAGAKNILPFPLNNMI